MTVHRIRLQEIERTLLEEAYALSRLVWPRENGQSLKEEVDAVFERMTVEGDEWRESGWLHWVEASGQLAAMSVSFVREIKWVESGRRAKVLALAGVCVDPVHRGKGWGADVVKDAFERLEEEGLALSLFQTGVPDFYRKLGSQVVENRFINSLAGDKQEENPWWDLKVMVHPAEAIWDEGVVDLQGAAY